MFIEQPNKLVRLIWKATWRKDSHRKVVYLTFDDGPRPETTEWILNTLKQYGVKATFFCVGDNVRKFPGHYKKILSEGHRVGNHTMHHLKGFNCSLAAYLSDVEEAAQYINSNLFRPPYGRITLKQLEVLQKKYEVIMWDVITRDYNPKLKPETVCGFAKKYSRNGSIIVFHDSPKSFKNIQTALPETIEYLQKEGYSFELL